MSKDRGPLDGIRVLELGSSVAGPFCGRLFADFGAQVIKVELAEGDPVRSMGKRADGRSLYAASIFRNKDIVSIDLKTDEGRTLVRRMAARCDVLVENFRPGTLERMGLGYERLSEDNPGLVLVRISGFGQSGPYAQRAGYGAIGEALSGLRHLTGDPDRPPSRIAASVTDEVTGIYGCLGAMIALWTRQRTGLGQIVDASLFESAFSLIEPHVPAFAKLGHVANRAGARLPDSAPNNTYATRDGRHIHITAMGDAVFARLAEVVGEAALAFDERFRTQLARSANEEALDTIIAAWVAARPMSEIVDRLNAAGVPAAPIYTVADIFGDPHFKARDMLVPLQDDVLGTVVVPGVVPKLSATPGRLRHPGHATGEDTAGVLRELLGLSGQDIDGLLERGVIHMPASAPVRNETA